MRLHLPLSCLLLSACPSEKGTTDSDATDSDVTATAPPATDPPATDPPATDPGTSASTTDEPTTTGGPPVECIDGGIGPAFAWKGTAPAPGVAECIRITDDSLALDCTGDFTGIFTLELANSGELGIVTGDPLTVDYRVSKDGDAVTGEWLQVRGSNQWYIVATQGPTLTPPGAPTDWFHPNVEVTLLASDCDAVACRDGSGDENTPRALSFGQGDGVNVLGPGQDGGVPGEFGGESYHAAVSEAHTGLCGAGEAGVGVDLLAFSVVSSGFL